MLYMRMSSYWTVVRECGKVDWLIARPVLINSAWLSFHREQGWSQAYFPSCEVCGMQWILLRMMGEVSLAFLPSLNAFFGRSLEKLWHWWVYKEWWVKSSLLRLEKAWLAILPYEVNSKWGRERFWRLSTHSGEVPAKEGFVGFPSQPVFGAKYDMSGGFVILWLSKALQ